MQARSDGVFSPLLLHTPPPSQKQYSGTSQNSRTCRVNSAREGSKRISRYGWCKLKFQELRCVGLHSTDVFMLCGLTIEKGTGKWHRRQRNRQGGEGGTSNFRGRQRSPLLCKTNSYFASDSLLVSRPQC